MAFETVPADAYDRFMGRFSTRLSARFADLGLEGVAPLDSVLDVGCGPGILTRELVDRVGEASVSAVDPAPLFVAASAATFPAADVRQAGAEALPFADDAFDAALAQLVVHFMTDPVAGVAEMARVTRSGGHVSACVWDHAGGHGPLSTFWAAARELRGDTTAQQHATGSTEGDLGIVFASAGLTDVHEGRLVVAVDFADFDDWWEPYTWGVGPAGDHVRSLDGAARSALEARLRTELGEAPFTIEAAAWTAVGTAAAH
ncbi:class I SAM-dependent methyltransferase [soil metagenome]